MTYTNDQIRAAINAAEAIEKPLSPVSARVVVTQETLSALIYGANEFVQRDCTKRIDEMSEAIETAMDALRHVR